MKFFFLNLGELLVLRWQAELLDGHQLPGLALEEELEQREVVALRLQRRCRLHRMRSGMGPQRLADVFLRDLEDLEVP